MDVKIKQMIPASEGWFAKYKVEEEDDSGWDGLSKIIAFVLTEDDEVYPVVHAGDSFEIETIYYKPENHLKYVFIQNKK